MHGAAARRNRKLSLTIHALCAHGKIAELQAIERAKVDKNDKPYTDIKIVNVDVSGAGSQTG